MDDMQRYREIRDNADPEDPAKQLLASIAVSYDQALAEAIRLERQGEPGKVRALGFTETADLLGEPGPYAEALDNIAAAVETATDDTLRDGIRSMVRRVRPEAFDIWTKP